MNDQNAMISEINKMYRRLAVFVHPDHGGRIERRGTQGVMHVLSRAMELFDEEMEYDGVPRVHENEEK